ncbi:MAG: Two-component system sensor histidine kinase [uncultured Paraburkholderia sp.]|nr:MAG: Two-component system sensor histidine kinase [uncultured Paraburkholderia sp.]CAH2795595.1 MAG: Two-component system sensor histidine kinase [uncultured Paraburkholderia sp.]CAH2929915.1 MAG: Two-component system sensor histidine kinase [uncultured Paraburkholderia sp.]CAH2930995.1 MAG: Two-component system sensor histidine kinase [uncultured Paraburkholderia sp.]
MYAIPTAFVSAMFVVFGLYVVITQGLTRLSAPFLLMCSATFAWQGTWTLLFQTKDPQIAALLVRVGYLFILFLPTTFYHFVTEVAARRRERPVLLASYGLCVVLAVLLPGNEVVSGYQRFFFGYYPVAGPLHPLHVLQTVLLAALGLYSFAAVDYAVNYGYPFYPPGVLFIALSLGLLAITIVRYHLIHPYALAATIAHEIATPLATIGMHADEIASVWSHVFKGYRLAVAHGLYDDHEHSDQSERISQLATAIRREVSGTSAMVEMALASFTLDRLDRSRFSEHAVQQCVNSALERYPFRAGERERITVSPIGSTLRFSGSDTVVVFVLFNLLKNALHAIHVSGEGQIAISAREDQGFCVLQFRDTGPGIAPDVLPHIFDAFFSTKRHGSGAGMGLAFCRRATELLGGSIECTSVRGTHTTFTVRLPVPGSAADRALPGLPARLARRR